VGILGTAPKPTIEAPTPLFRARSQNLFLEIIFYDSISTETIGFCGAIAAQNSLQSAFRPLIYRIPFLVQDQLQVCSARTTITETTTSERDQIILGADVKGNLRLFSVSNARFFHFSVFFIQFLVEIFMHHID
jgi:hypothetical protein